MFYRKGSKPSLCVYIAVMLRAGNVHDFWHYNSDVSTYPLTDEIYIAIRFFPIGEINL
jgi:hypothetical protein